jgi:SNF2 family DNA or RNA helicase
VDEFNRSRRADSFAFLLSAKAGGVGLNLIGWALQIISSLCASS